MYEKQFSEICELITDIQEGEYLNQVDQSETDTRESLQLYVRKYEHLPISLDKERWRTEQCCQARSGKGGAGQRKIKDSGVSGIFNHGK